MTNQRTDTPAHSEESTAAAVNAYVLAIAMQKGGVGKTTSTINIGYALAQTGLRVLVIDLDPQGNTTVGLGIDTDGFSADEGTMYEVLSPDRSIRMPLREVVKPTEWGIDVAPTDSSLSALERGGLGPGGELRLRVALDTVRGDYDAILIDTPPALNHLTTSALGAAQDVCAIVSPEGPDELRALTDLDANIGEAQEVLNPAVDIRHVLVTNYSGGSRLAGDIRRAVEREWADEYRGVIRKTVRVGEAKGRQMPVAVHAPDSTAAEDYFTVGQFFADVIASRKES